MGTSAYQLVRNRAGLSWLIMIAATLLSFALGADHGAGALVVVLVLGIEAVEIHLVGLDFMELRPAPIGLRAAFEIYCVALWLVLSALDFWL